MDGKTLRLQKLFNGGENAVVVAIDHGFMDGPLPGMEDLPATIEKIDPSVDAVLLSPGMLKVVGGYFARKSAPLPMVRLNWSTTFCFEWGYTEGRSVAAFSAREAAALGAEVALISLTLQTGEEANDARNVEIFARLRREAHAVGLPVVGECFPLRSAQLAAGELHDHVLRGCRILAELGADAIKTFHTHQFGEVVRGCPRPILGLGGRTTPKALDSLLLAQQIIHDGAKGVVFGRNAIQRPDPRAYQQALCEVVKRGMLPEKAIEHYRLE